MLKSFDRATLAMLSMDSVANNPLTRDTAMNSMLFAFMSLFNGFIYTVGFHLMGETYQGLEWLKVILLWRLYWILR